jgi:(S)-mandelate dehydrogenase
MRKTLLCVEDYRQSARRRLPKLVFDYIDGGADAEFSVLQNKAAIDNIQFIPKCLVNVSQRNLKTCIFDKELAIPVVIAPTGLNGLVWPNGDIALAKAAYRANVPFILSTASTSSIEEVAELAGGNLWFQLYVLNRSIADALVARALGAGYEVLVLTVDVPASGNRLRDQRNGLKLPFEMTPTAALDAILHPGWTTQIALHGAPKLKNLLHSEFLQTGSESALYSRQMDASFSWDDLKRLRDRWPHHLVVKGVLNLDDAKRMVGMGIDALILSNHGGRQLDSTCAPIDVLAEIASSVAVPVMIDSGFRTGADIAKALAFGATAIHVGRATLFGLGSNGEDGAFDVLNILRDELDRTIAMLGCTSISMLSSTFIRPRA